MRIGTEKIRMVTVDMPGRMIRGDYLFYGINKGGTALRLRT